MISREEKQRIADKFFKDGDWYIVEKLIYEYLDPLRDVSTIDTKRSNDEIAAEIRGRQISYQSLKNFLNECHILGRISSNESTSFK